MPPRTRAATQRGSRDAFVNPLEALPLFLGLRILAALPVDTRLRCSEVSRGWRAVLAERSLWTTLDLRVLDARVADLSALLRAAAARAGGQLGALHLVAWNRDIHGALLAVLATNAATMRELTFQRWHDRDELPTLDILAPLFRVAPALSLLETGVWGGRNMLPVLCKEPPFGPLRIKALMLASFMFAEPVDWHAVSAGLALHRSLEFLDFRVTWPQAQAESDAMVGVLSALPVLRRLELMATRIPASALAGLLGSPSLESLSVSYEAPLLDSPATAAPLCAALRTNTRIADLELADVRLWQDFDAAAALLDALQAHPSLKHLSLERNWPHPEHAAAAGAALAALIVHSPSLTSLNIIGCDLGDAGLDPVVDALPQARHLRTLKIAGNDMSAAFADERMLPAMRVCTSLQVHLVSSVHPDLRAILSDSELDDEDDDEDGDDEVDEEDVDGEDVDAEDFDGEDLDDDEM